MGRIQSHDELDVYRLGFDAAMRIFELTKGFPKEETYSLTDQLRCSSRSVCPNVAEAAVPRLRSGCFAKTQTWIQFAAERDYLKVGVTAELSQIYDNVIGKLVRMIIKPAPWTLR